MEALGRYAMKGVARPQELFRSPAAGIVQELFTLDPD